MNKAIYIFFFIILISASCNLFCVSGGGDVTTENRPVDKFSRIELSGTGKVFIKQGSSVSLEVKADRNLLKYIETKVSGDKIRLKTSKCIRNVTKLEYYITVEDLRDIKISGAGDVEGENVINVNKLNISVSGVGSIRLDLNAKKLISDISGAGTITLSGRCDDHEIEISGSGSLKAYQLITNNVNSFISGAGSCEINVFENLKGRVSGVGSINYKGSPKQVDTKVSGAGSIRARE
jgi:hypothetical protein